MFYTSCAASYKPIDPTRIGFTTRETKDGIEINYKYDILRLSSNRKYSKSEIRHKIRVVAIKITNHNDFTVNVSKDLVFYAGDTRIFPLTSEGIKYLIGQNVPAYPTPAALPDGSP